MIVLPLGDLEQPFDALQTGLLHLVDQLASPTPVCKNFIKEGHVKTRKNFRKDAHVKNIDDLGEYKSHQVEINLETRETSSDQREALESPTSRTTDL